MEHEARRNGQARRNAWPHALLGAGLAAGTIVLALPTSVEARCLTVETPWTVQMPDGEVYEAGVLRICHRGDFSPVRAVEDVEIGGRTAGRWIARTLSSEHDRAGGAVALFYRQETGLMGLAGYAVPDARGGSKVVLLKPVSAPASAAADPVRGDTMERLIALAASHR